MYGRRGVLLNCTCISPFSSPFLFYSWVSLFFLDSMAVYVFVVCLYGCGVVWCGVVWLGSSLFLSGSSRGWCRQQSRWRGAIARLQLRRCWGLGRSHRRSTYRDILAHPNLSCRFQPSCFIVDCIKQCVMVFPCLFINIKIGIMASGWQLRPVPSRERICIAAVERPPP